MFLDFFEIHNVDNLLRLKYKGVLKIEVKASVFGVLKMFVFMAELLDFRPTKSIF